MNLSPGFEHAAIAELERLKQEHAATGSQIEKLRELLGQSDAMQTTAEPSPRPTAEPQDPQSKPAKPKASKPPKKPAAKPTSKPRGKPGETAERILDALRDENGALSTSDLCDMVGIGSASMAYQLNKLTDQGKVELAGRDGIKKLWRIKSRQVAGSQAAPATAAAKPIAKDGRQQPNLEGQILGLLQVQSLTPREIADQLKVDFGRVQVALSRLDRDGDIKYEDNGWRTVL